jgi:hypothetical protein
MQKLLKRLSVKIKIAPFQRLFIVKILRLAIAQLHVNGTGAAHLLSESGKCRH